MSFWQSVHEHAGWTSILYRHTSIASVYGTPPHDGFGGQLECVVKLFCALDDIHKTSLFPHDSQRLEP
ncbi:hypothetical protein OROMI_014282 [Orobanche minor]